MSTIKKISALFLALLVFLSGLPVRAAAESTDQLVQQLINYYHHYQDDAPLDRALILERIEALDPALAATWVNIMDFWSGVNGDMVFNSGTLPDGLPEDDSLCIIVMGYYLKSDGSMRDELYQRLQITLEAAEKYPNAYILCTGGGTGSSNHRITEAGQMANWLKKKGIDSDRIIVENQALSTIENATYGCALLYRDYPEVKHLAVITSDYHVYRSCLYFHVQSALEAYKSSVEPMKVVSNATCRVNPNASRDLDRQVEGVGMLTDLDVVDLSRPELTYLEKITVTGQTAYAPGDPLNLTVTAHYSNGYTRDVTAAAEFFGFDMTIAGPQTVSICYDELIERFQIEVISYQVESAPTKIQPAPTEAHSAPAPMPITEEAETHAEPDSILLFIGLGLILLLFILFYLKMKQAKKRRRRPRPVIKLD